MRRSILILILISLTNIHSQLLTNKTNKSFVVISPADTKEKVISKAANVVPTEAQYRWQQNEFIAFLHFGMNTFTDREWGEGTEDPKIFNPSKLDALQWARTLKSAGVKLIILTAKHHDGFCLWPSKYTEHSVKNSSWKNGKGDVVKEFVDACRKFNLKVGLYLSPWDRHEPTYGDSPNYNEHFRNQLRELLTGYGEISEVWFDGACGEGANGKKQIYDWPSYYKVIRELQPKAVIFGMAPDVRWVGTESGYGRETEWSVVPVDLSKLDKSLISQEKFPVDQIYSPKDLTGEDLGSREKIFQANGLIWYPAETDVSIRPGWFYHSSQDKEVKTPEKLVDIYFSSVGRNGVLLLNIPPDKRGLIHKNDIKALTGMRNILQNSFKKNFIENAKIKSASMKSFNASTLTDKNTYWTTEGNVDTASIEFILPQRETFDIAMLQEEIKVGQRIEKFHLEYWSGKEWKQFVSGTTIGYKRLLRFKPVKTNKIRLVIDQSRMNPTLADIGLYKLYNAK